jgi:hypothetical protein
MKQNLLRVRSCFSVAVVTIIGFLVIASMGQFVVKCYPPSGLSLSILPRPQIGLESREIDGTNVSGYVMTNTTWSLEASPYFVISDIVVVQGAVLTIEAGVVVRFASGTNLVVDGVLTAIGNQTDKIVFTSSSPAPPTRAPRGDWGEIWIRQTGQLSNVTCWTVEYANGGLVYDGNQTLSVSDSILRLNRQGLQSAVQTYIDNSMIVDNDVGVTSNGALTIRNSVISRNGMKALVNQGGGIVGGRVTVENCTFSSNINLAVESPLSVKNSDFFDNVAWTLGDDAELISQCTIINNSNGFGRAGDIENCNISWNGYPGTAYRIVDSVVTHNAYGFFLDWGGEAEDCIVSDNGGYGIRVMPNAKIIRCVITGNNGPGVVPNYGFQPPFEIHYCSIYNNSIYDLTMQNIFNTPEFVDVDVNATYNWWGTVNETLIGNKIYDYYDNYNLGRVFFEPFLVSPYFAEVEGTVYYIGVSSNSTISNFVFDRAERSIFFDVAGPEQTGGYCTVSIPSSLMWGQFAVFKDGGLLTKGIDYTLTSNSTHFTLNLTYDHTMHSFRIEADEVVPELSFYPVLVALSIVLLAFAIKHRAKTCVRRPTL